MRPLSRKTTIKPQRGGISNALFIWASIESLPPDLQRIADEITIHYPWGSLLHALVAPDLKALKSIAQLAHSRASLTILINISIFEDVEYCQRLGLPILTLERVKTIIVPQYHEIGIEVKHAQVLDRNIPYRTTWGQKLTCGSGRKQILWLQAIIR